MQKKDEVYVRKRMLRMEGPRRIRGRSKRRPINAVKKDIHVVGVTMDDTKDWVRWRQVISCG